MDVSTVFSLVDKLSTGQKNRNEIIMRANQLATAMMSASTFATGRLNAALLAKVKAEKVAIIAKLSDKDIEVFTRMNEQCSHVYASANALSHLTSPETLNIRIRPASRQEASRVLEILTHGENGLQNLLNETLAAPSRLSKLSKKEIDIWICEAIDRMCQITASANQAVRDLSKTI